MPEEGTKEVTGMKKENEQETEVKTIRKRKLVLELSDADVDCIRRKAGAAGITVAELIENFIADLVKGTYHNHWDAGVSAEEWYSRCWFGISPDKTFLRYLIDEENCLDEFVTLSEFLENDRNDILHTKRELEEGYPIDEDGNTYGWDSIEHWDMESNSYVRSYDTKNDWIREQRQVLQDQRNAYGEREKELREYWEAFLEWTDLDKEKLDMTTEIEKVKKWYYDASELSETE